MKERVTDTHLVVQELAYLRPYIHRRPRADSSAPLCESIHLALKNFQKIVMYIYHRGHAYKSKSVDLWSQIRKFLNDKMCIRHSLLHCSHRGVSWGRLCLASA